MVHGEEYSKRDKELWGDKYKNDAPSIGYSIIRKAGWVAMEERWRNRRISTGRA